MTTPDTPSDRPSVDDLVEQLEASDPAEAPDLAEELSARLGADLEELDEKPGASS